MIKSYSFLPAAVAEYEDAVVYYETREEGLGARLIREVEAAVALMMEFPEARPLVKGAPPGHGLRWTPLQSFPIKLVFALTGGHHPCDRGGVSRPSPTRLLDRPPEATRAVPLVRRVRGSSQSADARTDRSQREWRHVSLGKWRVTIRPVLCRLECPEHGVVTDEVPWAEHDSRFTRDFEDLVTWLTRDMNKTAVKTPLVVDQSTRPFDAITSE